MSTEAEESFQQLWQDLKIAFPIINDENRSIDAAFAFKTLQTVQQQGLFEFIEQYIIDKSEQFLRRNVVPIFWNKLSVSNPQLENASNVHDAVRDLYTASSNILSHYKVLQQFKAECGIEGSWKTTEEKLKLSVRSVLYSQLPLSYKAVDQFYLLAFKAMLASQNFDSSSDLCHVCENPFDCCKCKDLLEHCDAVNKYLCELGLFESLVGQTLTSLVYNEIENYIVQVCRGKYDESQIDKLEEWVNNIVVSWLVKIYNLANMSNMEILISNFRRKLVNLLYETYMKIRIKELFSIVIEYPESIPALEDINKCLPKTDLKSHLTERMQHALETRLLHPGVATPDILTAYIATVRSFRVLDPSGVLLDVVTRPIHAYLRSRDNTVRCVVDNLTEEGSGDLADELAKSENVISGADDDSSENWQQWQPEPVVIEQQTVPTSVLGGATTATTPSTTGRSSDILSMLVNVYGSKEMFINEYRNMLADRLLSPMQCNTEKEIRYLELLKLRFGDSALHNCEVMIKDVCDSRRLNAVLLGDQEYRDARGEFPISAVIVSALFWPAFKDEPLELPSVIRDSLEIYTRAFERQKGNRTLIWKPQLGLVDLELEFDGQPPVAFTVTPAQAAIIHCFQDRKQWNIAELSQELKMPATVLRKKISYWQSQGILIEDSHSVFTLVEDTRSKMQPPESICEEEDNESSLVSLKEQRDEELQVFWSYIVGMLTNLDSMPLERIHQMLKMFVSEGTAAIEFSVEELQCFLEQKVREHKLVYLSGTYQLPK